MPDTYGPTSLTPLAFYDPDSSSWRTSAATFPWDSTPSSLTLPDWGTWDGTALCELPMSERATSEPDSSSSLPTPRTSDANGAGAQTAVSLLPTPAVNDMGEGKTVEAWDAWTEKMRGAHGNGNGHGRSLAIEAQRLLPTPTSAAGMGGNLSRSGARSDELLLPGLVKTFLPTPTTGYTGTTAEGWRERRPAGNGATRQQLGDLGLAVQELHGATTSPPSDDTNTPSDDQPPGQLTIEDA